jgi:hypothetical protein
MILGRFEQQEAFDPVAAPAVAAMLTNEFCCFLGLL